MKRGTSLLLTSIALLLGVVAVLLRSLVATPAVAPEETSSNVAVPEPVRVSQTMDGPPTHASPASSGDGQIELLSDGDDASEWVRLNNETAALLENGDLEKACEGFRRCREAKPDNDIFRRNLAEALARYSRELYKNQELAEAIASVEEVLELAPEREDSDAMRQLLSRWRVQSAVEEDHWSEGSDLFTLSFDTDRRDILHNSQDVLDHLERSYEELRLYFGADPVREMGRRPIRIVLYDSREFDRVTGLGDWAGGVFDGTVRVSVDDLRLGNWRETLKHELVHAFLHELGGKTLPGWLNEGLAQLLENRPSDLEQARARLRRAGTLFELEKLRGSLVTWTDTDAIARAYAQTLVWVDDIRLNYGDEALRRMVRAAGEGGNVEAAFELWATVPMSFAYQTFTERLFQ